jgi:hypothetical protein
VRSRIGLFAVHCLSATEDRITGRNVPVGLETSTGSPGFRPLIVDQTERLHVSIHALVFY